MGHGIHKKTKDTLHHLSCRNSFDSQTVPVYNVSPMRTEVTRVWLLEDDNNIIEDNDMFDNDNDKVQTVFFVHDEFLFIYCSSCLFHLFVLSSDFNNY